MDHDENRLGPLLGSPQTCISLADFDQGRIVAYVEGTAPLDPELELHLHACEACRTFHEAYRELWEARARGEDVTAGSRALEHLETPLTSSTATPAGAEVLPGPRRWRGGLAALGGLAAAGLLFALIGPALLAEAPPAPVPKNFGGHIEAKMGPGEPEGLTVPRPYAPDGVITADIEKGDPNDAHTLYVFVLGDDGRLEPVSEAFVGRDPEWIGITLEAPIAELFPKDTGAHRLAFCATTREASELAGARLDALADSRTTRCVVRRFVVER